MAYEPLHHKYRPQIFADLVGQETIALTLTNAIANRKIAPAYLFTGPRGTGKTSSARILAKSLNCLESNNPTPTPCGNCEVCKAITNGTALDVMEIDAASNTGVDNIREIIERSRFAPVQCRYKVYAIDECHMLSTAAFNALLKTLEEPPPQVVFILATTDPQRVLSTIISRCQRFDYRRIPLEDMVEHLEYIAKQEQISINHEALTLIAQIANGGLRDAESLLDQLSLLPETITVEKVWDLVGAVPERDLLALLRAIKSDRYSVILGQCRSLLDRGREPLIVLQNLASFYLNLLIAKTAPQSNDLVAVTETCWQELCTEARSWEIEEILRGQQYLKEAETQIKQTTQPRLWLEVTLVGLLTSGYRQQSPTNKQLPANNYQQSTSSNQPATTNKQPSTNNHQQTTTSKQLPANNQQQTPTNKQLPTNNHQQTTSNKSTSSNHLPTNNQQQTTTNKQSAANNYQKPVASNYEPVDNEKIWQKVLDRLQPPTTKALLSQQCNLVSFQGSSAVVGISSKKLQKLHQGKVPNIEAAFEKVCQRKIKVSLEVASNTNQKSTSDRHSTPPSPIDPTIPSSSPSFVLQKKTETIQSQNVDHISAQFSSTLDSQAPEYSEKVIPINRNATKSDRNIISPTPVVTSITPTSTNPTKNLQSEPDTVLHSPTANESVVTNRLEFTSNQRNGDNLSPNGINQNYDPSILQQAIEDLTQSFEGELVELDSVNLSQFLDDQFQSNRLEVSESQNLNPPAKIPNSPSPTAKAILSGRPDLSEYENEDDIPF